jgi:hypothetical protein
VLGVIAPFICPVMMGANIIRRTIENIKAAGFINVEEIDLVGDVVKKIVIKNIR